ncbi:molybdopterin oxidoreductase [Sorangium sp. So ce1335]|uniref:molybdopterin oxidoreductase n=1 Tax=Sorangium sp. So ce1335 TaxID=3133335 RepID=UPI003F601F9D
MEIPRFIQGVYAFEGQGLEQPVPLRPAIGYTVPRDRRAQLIYLRAGNSTGELVYLLLRRDGQPMRYFPIGARAAIHVPLVIIEDIPPESVLELSVGAPEGVRGLATIDIGLAEI